MADDKSPHSGFDSAGPIVDIELSGHGPPVFVDHAFHHLGIEFNNDPATPPLEVVSGFEWPQVKARYIVTQPESLAEDPRRGWAPVGGIYEYLVIDPSKTVQFTFSETAVWDALLLVCGYDTYLSLTACGDTLATAHIPIGSLITGPEAGRRYYADLDKDG